MPNNALYIIYASLSAEEAAGKSDARRRRSDERYARGGRGRGQAHPHPHPSLLFIVIFLLISLLQLIPPASATYSTIVNNGSEECFEARTPRQPATGRYVVSGNYDLLDDGTSARPLSVVLYNSKMKPMYQSRFARSEDTFSVSSGAGEKYTLCIRNGIGAAMNTASARLARSEGVDDDDEVAMQSGNKDGLDRTVGFALRVRTAEAHFRDVKGDTADKDKSESEKKAEDLLELGNELIDSLETMTDHQAYLREREAAHREMSENTFSLVMIWTVLEAVVLVIVAGGQIFYLRRFIEKRRYL